MIRRNRCRTRCDIATSYRTMMKVWNRKTEERMPNKNLLSTKRKPFLFRYLWARCITSRIYRNRGEAQTTPKEQECMVVRRHHGLFFAGYPVKETRRNNVGLQVCFEENLTHWVQETEMFFVQRREQARRTRKKKVSPHVMDRSVRLRSARCKVTCLAAVCLVHALRTENVGAGRFMSAACSEEIWCGLELPSSHQWLLTKYWSDDIRAEMGRATTRRRNHNSAAVATDLVTEAADTNALCALLHTGGETRSLMGAGAKASKHGEH